MAFRHTRPDTRREFFADNQTPAQRAATDAIGTLKKSAAVNIIPLFPGLLDAAWNRCLRYSDKDWDWIDCTSFELMEQRGLGHALSLDHHFAQAGFTLLV